MWRASILEILSQTLGKNIHEIGIDALDKLGLPNDRVKLHNLFLIHYIVVDNVIKNSEIDFNQQDYILLKKRYKEEQRKRK